jgi:uridine kinase
MRVFLTGPSCAGKTELAKQLPAVVIHLDQARDEQSMTESGREDHASDLIVYEGIPCGSDSSVKKFLGEIDMVLLLDTAVTVRLLRCWRRDGWQSTFRWLYNEWCWRVICCPLIREHHNIRRIRWEAA